MTWKSKHCKQTIEKTSQKRIPFLLPKSIVNIELEYGCQTSGCPLIWIWRFSTNKVWTLEFCGNLQVYMSIPITWEFLVIMSLAQLCIGKQLKCREHVAEGAIHQAEDNVPAPPLFHLTWSCWRSSCWSYSRSCFLLLQCSMIVLNTRFISYFRPLNSSRNTVEKEFLKAGRPHKLK